VLRLSSHYRVAAVLAVLILVAMGIFAGTIRAANDSFVQPFDVTTFSAGIPTDANSTRIRSILSNANKYALTTWWTTKYASQNGTYLDFGGTGENNIRPPASEAYALAAAIATNGYDATATGVSLTTARSIAVKLIASVALRHIANSVGGWSTSAAPSGSGSPGWQTAYWAALAGTAGWLMWNDLSVTDQGYVRKMVEFEANRFIGYHVPYWKDRSGSFSRACGDTAAEENAWNAQLLLLAPVMMPQHSRRSGWTHKGLELAIGSFARPSDIGSSTDVLGRPLTDWLEGTNVNNDGTLVNHNIYHPDYMTTVSELVSAGVVDSLAHQATPTGVLHDADLEYAALVQKAFAPPPALPCPTSPAFLAPPASDPSGFIYISGGSDIFYPEGNDWGTDRRMHFADMDAMATAFGFDNLVSSGGTYWEPFHAQKVLDMQSRSSGGVSDGRTYYAAGEDTYAGREEWVAREAGQAWLTKWIASKSAIQVANPLEQIVLDDADRGVTISGSWTVGSPQSNGPQVFGPTVKYKAAGTGAAYVRFTPRMTQSRTYKVYAWWVASSAQATNAPFSIRNSAGTTTVVTADERANGGMWNYLGSFSLGSGSYVQLTDNANGYVVADAILLDPN
jgi:hypothetical protein